MTTKPKTRKAPAAKADAPKAEPKEAPNGTPTQVSEIQRLIARHKFLWADEIYQSTVAATVEESDALDNLHGDEIGKIEYRLAEVVPENFTDICQLLDFATEMAKEGGRDDLEIDMLRNVRAGLSDVWCIDMEAERKKAVEEAENKMRREVRWVIETKEWKEAQVKEFRAGLTANQKAA